MKDLKANGEIETLKRTSNTHEKHQELKSRSSSTIAASPFVLLSSFHRKTTSATTTNGHESLKKKRDQCPHLAKFRKNYSRESKALAAVEEDELHEKITIKSDGHATVVDTHNEDKSTEHTHGDADGSTGQNTASITPSRKRKRSTFAPGMDKIIYATENLPSASCCTCNVSLSSARLHACLDCVYVGCWKDNHIHSHMTSKNHNFAMDFVNCVVYCFGCKDYVYDLEFDHVLNTEQSRLDTLISRVREPNVERVTRPHWIPSKSEIKRIVSNSKLQQCSGLRGLHNMGSTCFMNSILQTFIHNPLLRAHFLSDKHNKNVCSQKNGVCMACELDILYHNFFNGDRTPYAPISFLSSMWKCQKHLAGYSQQDAHEFLISVLNEVHHNMAGYNHDVSLQCNCIIHEVFGGVLQSEVICLKCETVTTALDPMLDLSLDIKQPTVKPIQPGSGKHRKHSLSDPNIHSVQTCLDRFTEPEKLGSNQYTCSTCGGTSQEATKQLSFRKLPPVLSIQLKRFEHSINSSTKIDTFVQIPAELDMTKHTTRSIKLRHKLNRGKKEASRTVPLKGIPGFDTIMDGVPTYKYSLFAIVHHEGKIDTGHYKTYAKFRGDWFLFDDHTVTQTTQKEALNCHAYMCFYLRDNVEYSPFGGKSSVYTTLTSPPVETPPSKSETLSYVPLLPHTGHELAGEEANGGSVEEEEEEGAIIILDGSPDIIKADLMPKSDLEDGEEDDEAQEADEQEEDYDDDEVTEFSNSISKELS